MSYVANIPPLADCMQSQAGKFPLKAHLHIVECNRRIDLGKLRFMRFDFKPMIVHLV